LDEKEILAYVEHQEKVDKRQLQLTFWSKMLPAPAGGGSLKEKRIFFYHLRIYTPIFFMKNLKILMVSYFFHPFMGQASDWRTRSACSLANRGHSVSVLRVKNDRRLTICNQEQMIPLPNKVNEIAVPVFCLKYIAEKVAKRLNLDLNQQLHEDQGTKNFIQKRQLINTHNLKQKLKSCLKKTWSCINFPDGRLDWIFMSTIYGIFSCLKHRPDVVYSICNPQSNVIIGLILSKFCRRPLVLDYKDAWTLDENLMAKKSRIYKWISKKIESSALKTSCRLIGVTDGIIDSYEKLYPDESSGKWELITHGFDKVIFEKMEKDFQTWQPPLKIVYAATNLNGVSYTLNTFLEALKLANMPEKKFHLLCFGNPAGADRYARSLGLSSADVEFFGPCDKGFVVNAYRRSDLLLTILNNSKWNEKKYTSKLFDLLGARRPILACVPLASRAAELVHNLKVGKVTENDKVETIVRILLEFFEEFSLRKINMLYDTSEKLQFERENLVEKLERCLTEAVKKYSCER